MFVDLVDQCRPGAVGACLPADRSDHRNLAEGGGETDAGETEKLKGARHIKVINQLQTIKNYRGWGWLGYFQPNQLMKSVVLFHLEADTVVFLEWVNGGRHTFSYLYSQTLM